MHLPYSQQLQCRCKYFYVVDVPTILLVDTSSMHRLCNRMHRRCIYNLIVDALMHRRCIYYLVVDASYYYLVDVSMHLLLHSRCIDLSLDASSMHLLCNSRRILLLISRCIIASMHLLFNSRCIVVYSMSMQVLLHSRFVDYLVDTQLMHRLLVDASSIYRLCNSRCIDVLVDASSMHLLLNCSFQI